jgi:hypothetical protein
VRTGDDGGDARVVLRRVVLVVGAVSDGRRVDGGICAVLGTTATEHGDSSELRGRHETAAA